MPQSNDLFDKKSPWIDDNGLVKSSKYAMESGNGLLYTSVAVLLSVVTDELKTWYLTKIRSCMKRPGLYMRTPQGNFANESFDDYLGIISACIRLNETKTLRDIFWYGVRHLFFFYDKSYFSLSTFFSSWLGRFPHVFMLCFAGAYPKLKWLVHFPLFIIECLQTPCTVGEIGASAIQLQFVFMTAYLHLYGRNNTFTKWRNAIDLKLAFSIYYDKEHPFLEML